ncbi:SIS domain-containing protein [Hyalangium versicolor]|uniref:SIS domain-containing protein n=1 Tax=Hyalangium versicolor TaxID=2861190 RepID=UPI001CCE0E4D|nr:SIS domain-containing protein [Hyalangium versicolor]
MTYSEAYYSRMVKAIHALDYQQVDFCMDLVEAAWKEGRQIFTMGNGGSASTASHFVCDWNKGVSYKKEHRIRAICLNDNVPTMMAYANDVSYLSVFEEPLKNFMRPGDLVIGISGSGNSPNVLNAIQWANENGGITLGITGYDGGKLKLMSRHSLHVNVNDMQIVEDLHLSFGHVTMQRLSGMPAECYVEKEKRAATGTR